MSGWGSGFPGAMAKDTQRSVAAPAEPAQTEQDDKHETGEAASGEPR